MTRQQLILLGNSWYDQSIAAQDLRIQRTVTRSNSLKKKNGICLIQSMQNTVCLNSKIKIFIQPQGCLPYGQTDHMERSPVKFQALPNFTSNIPSKKPGQVRRPEQGTGAILVSSCPPSYCQGGQDGVLGARGQTCFTLRFLLTSQLELSNKYGKTMACSTLGLKW